MLLSLRNLSVGILHFPFNFCHHLVDWRFIGLDRLDWTGLNDTGLEWLGLKWLGLRVWLGLKWLGVVRNRSHKNSWNFQSEDLIFTGAQPKAGTGHKMQTVSVVFSTLHCWGYTADFSRYIGSSLLLGVLAGSLKSCPPFWKARGMEDSQEKDCRHYSFLGNDTRYVP